MLKEQVKTGKLSAKNAITQLIDKGDKWASKSKTFGWLVCRMEQEKIKKSS